MNKNISDMFTTIMTRRGSEASAEGLVASIKNSRIKMLDSLVDSDEKLQRQDDLARLRGMLEYATPDDFKKILEIATTLL